MDDIPDSEFIEIFNRISIIVLFGRCFSPQEVGKRIKRALNFFKKAQQTAKKRSTARAPIY